MEKIIQYVNNNVFSYCKPYKYDVTCALAMAVTGQNVSVTFFESISSLMLPDTLSRAQKGSLLLLSFIILKWRDLNGKLWKHSIIRTGQMYDCVCHWVIHQFAMLSITNHFGYGPNKEMNDFHLGVPLLWRGIAASQISHLKQRLADRKLILSAPCVTWISIATPVCRISVIEVKLLGF